MDDVSQNTLAAEFTDSGLTVCFGPPGHAVLCGPRVCFRSHRVRDLMLLCDVAEYFNLRHP